MMKAAPISNTARARAYKRPPKLNAKGLSATSGASPRAYSENWGGRRPGAGRPTEVKTPVYRVSLALDQWAVNNARAVGNGNMSAGVRRALRHCQNINKRRDIDDLIIFAFDLHEKTKCVSITLDKDSHLAAYKIGDGSISAGVRLALMVCRRDLDMAASQNASKQPSAPET